MLKANISAKKRKILEKDLEIVVKFFNARIKKAEENYEKSVNKEYRDFNKVIIKIADKRTHRNYTVWRVASAMGLKDIKKLR